MPLDSTTRFSVQDVCEQIGVLAEEAMRFVPPAITNTQFKPALASVAASDADADVRFFAARALEKCDAVPTA